VPVGVAHGVAHGVAGIVPVVAGRPPRPVRDPPRPPSPQTPPARRPDSYVFEV
jgi:hypothetical protein